MPEKRQPSFSVRDYVQLKTGGPVMKIIASSRGEGMAEGINSYTCRWLYEEGQEKEGHYQEADLLLVQKG